MASRDDIVIEITPQVLLKAYTCGIFPMAESVDDPTLFWVEPELRGIIPLDGFRVASRLARTVRSDAFTVTVNRNFAAVIDGCGEFSAFWRVLLPLARPALARQVAALGAVATLVIAGYVLVTFWPGFGVA